MLHKSINLLNSLEIRSKTAVQKCSAELQCRTALMYSNNQWEDELIFTTNCERCINWNCFAMVFECLRQESIDWSPIIGAQWALLKLMTSNHFQNTMNPFVVQEVAAYVGRQIESGMGGDLLVCAGSSASKLMSKALVDKSLIRWVE